MLPHPMQQSDAFARTLTALGTGVALHNSPRCVVQTRRIPLVGPVHLISRGPLVKDPGDIAAALNRLGISGPLVVNADEPLESLPGFVKVANPKRIALLPLAPPNTMRAALHQKWRNGMRRAERLGVVTKVSRYNAQKHAWIIEADQTQQRNRGYRNWPPHFLNTYAAQNPQDAVVFTTFQNDHRCAALVILCHAPWATYHLGVTTPNGRDCAAHAHGLWTAMTWLYQNGYTTLDLGHLTGPTGLDRFKLRTGAHAHTLGGTWVRLPHALRRWRSYWPSIQSPSGQKA